MPIRKVNGFRKSVVIVASGNSVPTESRCSLQKLEQIVKDVISSGTLCKDHGVQKVLISSFLPRQSAYYQSRRHHLNEMLRSECQAKGFAFIENKDILLQKHISEDGVHLNARVSSMLCKNIVNQLNKED